MLTITTVSNREGITVKPALEFSFEREVYLAPVNWTGETLMLCVLPQRLQQEFTQAVENGGDIADVFDPETYRETRGEGVYLDLYHYTPLESREKNQSNYMTGVGICYVAIDGDRYTRADFLRLCNGEEAVALRLFDLCDWQAPETLLLEEFHDQGMQLPTFKFAPSLELSSLTFHPEGPVPDEAKQALLRQAGWKESFSRTWTHQGQAPVPQGIAYVSDERPCVLDIEPTPGGYRAMKKLFQKSIATYRTKLSLLDTLSTLDGPFTADIHELLEEMIVEKRAVIDDAVESLTEHVAQLERCGY